MPMSDPHEQRILADIERYGWHALAIFNDPLGPFVYTVGLMLTFDHDEVVITGLAPKTAHSLMSVMVEKMKNGRRFLPGSRHDDIIEGYPCRIIQVDPAWHVRCLGYAMWYGHHIGRLDQFEAVQLVWPDKKGHFPDELECDPRMVEVQPLMV